MTKIKEIWLEKWLQDLYMFDRMLSYSCLKEFFLRVWLITWYFTGYAHKSLIQVIERFYTRLSPNQTRAFTWIELTNRVKILPTNLNNQTKLLPNWVLKSNRDFHWFISRTKHKPSRDPHSWNRQWHDTSTIFLTSSVHSQDTNATLAKEKY